MAGWFDAAVLCTAQGKRLCLPEEWQTACQGGEAQRLNSSTDDPALFAGIGNFGLRYCNTDGSLFTIDLGSELEDRIAPSGRGAAMLFPIGFPTAALVVSFLG